MQKQVARAGLPAPRAIGVDEIAIRKGHDDRIVGSDFDRRRPIWVGGKGRTEADLDLFFAALGANKTARVLFDTFHIVRHLGDALDEVRRHESRRLTGKDWAFITGPRDTRLSNRKHLSHDGRASLKKRLRATKRLNTASRLKESFASSGAPRPRAGPAPASSAGDQASSGNGSSRTSSSRR